jgi:hypothetical protein
MPNPFNQSAFEDERREVHHNKQNHMTKPKQYNGRLKDGLWSGVPMETYHRTEHLSSSLLRTLMRSPLEYKRAIDGAGNETTAAMEYGTVAHAAILENKLNAFHIRPDTYADNKPWNGNSAECKEWARTHADRPVLTVKQVHELSEAANYVHAHPKAGKLLRGGHVEVSAFAAGQKARCDYLKIDGDSATVVDLKTCTDAATAAFGKEIVNRGYHIQFAWYRRVLRSLGFKHFQFYFIALQKGRPLVNVWMLQPAAMDMVERQIDDALLTLARCKADGIWPEWADYDGTNEIKVIDVPEWAYKDGDEPAMPTETMNPEELNNL